MARKHQLYYSIHQALAKNRQGSFAARADRITILKHFAHDLIQLGYGLNHIQGLQRKHIEAVVAHWQTQGLSVGTLKNRTSTLRHLARILDKSSAIPSNTELQLGQRCYVPKQSKALNAPDFTRISDPRTLVSLQLQRVFGLRREEALKIKPHAAEANDHLTLQPSWCKGGRGRCILIQTEEQRYWLEQAKTIVNSPLESLIPPGKSYIQQRHVYDKQTQRAGLRNLHGLRHAYAQRRYRELTGWHAPLAGGPKMTLLTPEQKAADEAARLIISDELGHSRLQITINYLGR